MYTRKNTTTKPWIKKSAETLPKGKIPPKTSHPGRDKYLSLPMHIYRQINNLNCAIAILKYLRQQRKANPDNLHENRRYELDFKYTDISKSDYKLPRRIQHDLTLQED